MSVHKRNGRWQVKWREGDRQRSRTFDRKGDADTFDREVSRAKQLGPKLVRELTAPQTITLREFAKTGFRMHAATLHPGTRKKYRGALNGHLRELLDLPLTEIDVPRIAEHQDFLIANDRSVMTVRKAIAHLSGILQVAAEHGLIHGNPARAVRKPAADAEEEVRPLSPVELEAVIAAFSGRDRIVALLAGHLGLGLRPVELRSAPWGNLTDGGLIVGRGRTKRTAARTRVVTIPAATMLGLKRWRLESGRPGDDQPIVGNVTESWIHQWSGRRLAPVVKAITGREDVTLYTLRHTHASVLHYCGFTVPSASRRMGHDGTTHLRTYAHIIESLEGQRYADLDAAISAARADLAEPAV